MRKQLLLSTLPFFSCLLGYLIFSSIFFQPCKIQNVVGLTLPQAVLQISPQRGSLQVMGVVSHDMLPAYTILSQVPSADAQVKPPYTINVIISMPAHSKKMIQCTPRSKEHVMRACISSNIRPTLYAFEYPQRAGYCVAQTPLPETMIKPDEDVALFIARESDDRVIIPSFTDMPFNEVKEIMATFGFKYHVIESEDGQQQDEEKIIALQKPSAGTIMQKSKPALFQFAIKNDKKYDNKNRR
jgi:beta-lactam-binding protein with PASTA domain